MSEPSKLSRDGGESNPVPIHYEDSAGLSAARVSNPALTSKNIAGVLGDRTGRTRFVTRS